MSVPSPHKKERSRLPRAKQADSDAAIRAAPGDGTPDIVTINVGIPRDLHRRFRVQAVLLDMTLTDAVTDAIERWLTE